MRLAAFYNARTDALELCASMGTRELDEKMFDQMVSTFSPDHYDFGKAPKTPVDHGVEIAKNDYLQNVKAVDGRRVIP